MRLFIVIRTSHNERTHIFYPLIGTGDGRLKGTAELHLNITGTNNRGLRTPATTSGRTGAPGRTFMVPMQKTVKLEPARAANPRPQVGKNKLLDIYS